MPLRADSSFQDVTGGWAGLLQGGLGSLLGIFGAFAIALWTTRHELNRDRENLRNQARVAVTDRLSPILHDMAAHLEHLDDSHVYADQVWAGRRVSAWLEIQRRYKRQVDESAALLPDTVRASLTEVEARLEAPYYVNDDPPAPVFFEPGDGDQIAALNTAIDAAMTALINMRTAIYAPEVPPLYKRLWYAWTVAAIIALMLGALLIFD